MKSMLTRVTCLALLSGAVHAAPPESPPAQSSLAACLERQFREASPEVTMREVRAICGHFVSDQDSLSTSRRAAANVPREDPGSLILERLRREQEIESVRSSLTPHKRNYLIPVSYVAHPNDAPFASIELPGAEEADLDNLEAKFQVSIKAPLLEDLFRDGSELYFGFTATSFWQVYNRDISSPFRETNYEPEIFWITPLEWRPFNSAASVLVLGFSHQSNGQAGTLSRSWNRIYANLIWEKNGFVFSLKPWYRIPESAGDFPGDPSGDDNPDIEEYLGNFEFVTAWRRGDHELTLMLRNNLRSDNRGAVQLEWTFPLLRRVRGYAQYFNGYGESLIDYDDHIERFGIGIQLTGLL